jgi:hypothetical protein
MTLHSPNIYNNSHWEFSNFDECFEPSKIKLSDIDGIVERRGHFIVLETKKPSVKSLPVGQFRMYNAMNAIGCFTILIVWGNVNSPIRYEIWDENRNKTNKECDMKELCSIIRKWFVFSDNYQNICNKFKFE